VRLRAITTTVPVALVAAPAATARIVSQQSMARRASRDNQAQVRALLGTPLRIVRGTNDFRPYREFRFLLRVRVSFGLVID
jgi:hypothetical protein